ncbi:MAG: hypothetical protein GXP47_12390, partial [Acidobacteria bacterium]|nr:hypothetical protein [Acidobacteriota bacterium]
MMKQTVTIVRRSVFWSLVVLLAVLVVVPAPAAADDPKLPDSTYDAFYPKRARGYQPTAWEVTKIDDVNLYN